MLGSNVGRQYLFTDQATNATSPAVQLTYPNGKCLVSAWSPSDTWDGATITLYYLAADGTQIPISLAGNIITYTANQGLEVTGFPYGEQMVAVMTNSGGSADVTVTVDIVAGT